MTHPTSKPLTEEELKIVQKVCKKFAARYSFAYWEPEDIESEAFIIALEGMKSYDGRAPLENFLSVHLSNRLKNFIRKHYNPKSHNIINAIPLYSVDDENEDNMRYSTNNIAQLSSKELEKYIDENLPSKFRADYLKLLDDEYIIPSRKRALIETLTALLTEYYDLENQ